MPWLSRSHDAQTVAIASAGSGLPVGGGAIVGGITGLGARLLPGGYLA
jgi:hypothetical protein